MVRFYPDQEKKGEDATDGVQQEVGAASNATTGNTPASPETSTTSTAGYSTHVESNPATTFEEILSDIYEALPPAEKEDTPEMLAWTKQLHKDVLEGKLDMEKVFEQFAERMCPSKDDKESQVMGGGTQASTEPQPGPSRTMYQTPVTTENGINEPAAVQDEAVQVSSLDSIGLQTADEWYARVEKIMGPKMPDLLYDQHFDRVRKLSELDASGQTSQISPAVELMDLIEVLRAVEQELARRDEEEEPAEKREE